MSLSTLLRIAHCDVGNGDGHVLCNGIEVNVTIL